MTPGHGRAASGPRRRAAAPAGRGTPADVLVVGLGHGDRGDDAAGPAVAARIAALHLPGVRAIGLREPSRLLEEWAGTGLVVVADAVRSGRPPGTVAVLHVRDGRLPAGPATPGGDAASGTHGFGLAEVIGLSRSLGRVPRDLVIVAVEAQQFRLGAPLSPPVRLALETMVTVVTQVIGCVTAEPTGEDGPRTR